MNVKGKCLAIFAALWGLGGVFVGGVDFSRADIYKYVDSDGVIHFTNVPTDNRFSLFLSEKSISLAREDFYRFDQFISKAADKYDIEFELIKAVIKVESDFNSLAVSRKGARGLMQLMPATAKELKVKNSFDPVENIDAGTRYLKSLLGQFNGNLSLALAAYNAGKDAVIKNRKQIPPYKETREYVQKVIRYFDLYIEDPDYID